MSLVGQTSTNRYGIERELARCRAAEVYLACDQSLDRPVALKAFFPETADEISFVNSFLVREKEPDFVPLLLG